MIDLIIPTYNARKYLDRTLCSIANQVVAKELVDVMLVDDASTETYDDIIDKYRDNFKSITLKKLETNCGPGVARQVGMESTSNPYVMFMDADDVFCDIYAIEKLYEAMIFDARKERIVMVTINFYEECYDKSMVSHEQDATWVFAKLYDRDKIERNGLKFNDTRSNEDVGFNTKLMLLSQHKKYLIKHLPDYGYVWLFNSDSITKENDFIFTFTRGFSGYIDNKIEAIKEYSYVDGALSHAYRVFIVCYRSYNEACITKPMYRENVLSHSIRFVQELLSDPVTEEDFLYEINKCRDLLKDLNIWPVITIWDFARLCNMKLINK